MLRQIKLKKPKKCSCGHVHREIPKTAKMLDLAYWFDCEGGCGSTLMSRSKNWDCGEAEAGKSERAN